VDLRPHARLHLDQRGLPQLTPSRLDRRPGAAEHYPAAFLDALADRIRRIEPAGAATMVAIDGWGCGGKTALAEGLLDRLEPTFQYLGTDEFFAGFGVVDAGPIKHLRWAEIEAAWRELRKAARTEARGYDWEAGRIMPVAPLAGRAWLAEGLFTLHLSLRRFYDLTIWVQGRVDNRLTRVAARDGAHMIPFWEREWMPTERQYMASHRPWLAADIIVAGAGLEVGELGGALAASV
jgi:uridine kinase